MKKVVLIAPTGMLGSMVYNVLKDNFELVLVFRSTEKLSRLEEVYGGVSRHRLINFDLELIGQDYLTGFQGGCSPEAQKLFEAIGEVDAVINCAGIIKPNSLKNPLTTWFINSAFPHVLSERYGEKLIQITTDCAFSGKFGEQVYTEVAPKTPNDLYGLTKSVGEPSLKSLVLRTSIIGPEISDYISLIEWFKKQAGQNINGFTTHFWNGITTKQYGLICKQIIENRDEFPKTGIYHVFSSDVTKYEMLVEFKKKYSINVNIEPLSPPVLDRRLRTVYDLCSKLQIPSFKQMIKEL